MKSLVELLRKAVEDEASDVFIVAGKAASEKVDGHIVLMDEGILLPPETEKMIMEIYETAGRSVDRFIELGDDDFSFSLPGLARFRVNAYRQRGSMAAVIRVISFDIPDWKEFRIPEEIMKISEIQDGMVLFTGIAGSGKSTTQACIIDRINNTKDCHIVTLEDPIEFLHRHKKSLISQREISIDTTDYLSAMRACLRQSPDVILLGEMRDAQTIQTALTAAETGHTIIATLHTKGAVNAVNRIIDGFPNDQQVFVRAQLSTVLRTVVSQQLLPGVNGTRVPAFEIMHLTNAVKSMIRDNKAHQINNAISSGNNEGMISMDQSILALYKEGAITKETALEYADNPEQLKRWLQ
ncbi:MAG: PilT/PilU family type 4a pilus ATPase [Firmicutes bacterium]|nr:PilT/PilU family type 4a pilus ATPase [Bacillota bacterium]